MQTKHSLDYSAPPIGQFMYQTKLLFLLSIASVDLADCGKLLVCHVTAKNEADLTVEEARIVKLFKSFNGKVDPLHAQAQYMLAAQTGAFKKPEVCTVQYQRCPYPAENLSELLKQ